MPIASHTPPCSPMREKRAAARSVTGACQRVRARSSSCSSRARNELRAEADAQLLGLGAHVHDLGEIQTHRALLAVQVVPPLALDQLFVEQRELLVAHPNAQHLSALEPDAYAPPGGGHQCSPEPAAGSTISVSTPPVARG